MIAVAGDQLHVALKTRTYCYTLIAKVSLWVKTEKRSRPLSFSMPHLCNSAPRRITLKGL